ncbi:MAG: CaiB/BaiF CoA-transferase family protein [Polyangiales bacterium]
MGPLEKIRIVEIEGIGPCPFAGMLLADLGAEVIRVGRPEPSFLQANFDVMSRGKRSITLDLKKPDDKDALLKVVATADALIEGFRPGVMERLGIGPEVCMEINPRLVFGRMTGWGQEGPWAKLAGHDINYIALAGALHAIGHKGERPTVPLNLVGDFGGGGLLLAFGVVAALLETQRSGKGQVVDAAMVDGVAALMASIYAGMQQGFWSDRRGENLLDSGAAFYDVYETSDGKYISIGSLEPQFYKELIEKLGIQASAPAVGEHLNPAKWNDLRPTLEALFRQKTRDQWCQIFEGSDACFAPVLATAEVFEHEHHVARRSFVEIGGIKHAVAAPRFSRTKSADPTPARERGADTEEILRECGVTPRR